MSQTAEKIYQQYIKTLPDVEKLRLIAKIAENLAEELQLEREPQGLDEENHKDVDTQK